MDGQTDAAGRKNRLINRVDNGKVGSCTNDMLMCMNLLDYLFMGIFWLINNQSHRLDKERLSKTITRSIKK